MAYPVQFTKVRIQTYIYLAFFFFFFSLMHLLGSHIGFTYEGVWLHIDMAAPVKKVGEPWCFYDLVYIRVIYHTSVTDHLLIYANILYFL